MPRTMHLERHTFARIGWLRAAVLGANDGIVSTGSLIVGVAASQATPAAVLLAGAASLVAGAMSMAAGEYVSVSSQADTEQADLAREKSELAANWDTELTELAQIYEQRGLDPNLARQVATQLMAKDALGAHIRDELGLTEVSNANPIQAALTSALTFVAGAALPQLAAWVTAGSTTVPAVAVVSLIVMAVLGALGARTGGAPLWTGIVRVAFWGALAMIVTSAVGALFGTVAC